MRVLHAENEGESDETKPNGRSEMTMTDDQRASERAKRGKSRGGDPHLDPQFAEPTHIHPSCPVANPFTIHVRPCP